MSRDYLTILQLSAPASTEKLDRAYQRSKLRFLRLTQRGPLRYYRKDLLAAAEKAYRQLKQPTTVISERPMSLRARQVAKQGGRTSKPALSSFISKKYCFFDKIERLPERTGLHRYTGLQSRTDYKRGNSINSVPQPQPDKTRQRVYREDLFCRQVIYRLEGELIRYDSRQDLMVLARDLYIGKFRANMLIAQIVESVRQHKLYQPTPKEQHLQKRKSNLSLVILAVVLAVMIDIILILFLK